MINSCSQAQRLFSSNSRYLRKFDNKGKRIYPIYLIAGAVLFSL